LSGASDLAPPQYPVAGYGGGGVPVYPGAGYGVGIPAAPGGFPPSPAYGVGGVAYEAAGPPMYAHSASTVMGRWREGGGGGATKK